VFCDIRFSLLADPVLSLLDVLIFLPILAAVAMAFRLPARPLGLAAAFGLIGVTIALICGFKTGQDGWQFAAARPILINPDISFSVGIDGMSLVLVLLTSLVTLAAVWMKAPEGVSEKLWYGSCLLIAAGAMGAFVCTDVLFLYAFHELALIPTFLMIGLYGNGGRELRVEAAWKITIYLAFGSMVLLAGLAWLVVAKSPAGHLTFDVAKLLGSTQQVTATTQANIFALLFIGFGILISLFPFHSWAAPAYAAAPAPVAMLHSGVLKKFGLYGLLRLAVPMLPAGFQMPWVQHLMLWLLVGNIIIIGFVTIAQRQLDHTLGNSSVMHMGYAFLGIASGNAIGMGGSVLLMFAHGVSIALLFALCHHVRSRTGTLEYSRLGGLAQKAPTLGFIFGIAAMASVGLPGFANFAAEAMVFFSSFKGMDMAKGLQPLQWAAIAGLWGVVISAVYMLRGYRNVFKGSLSVDTNYKETPLTMQEILPLGLLVLALLVVGFYPNTLLGWLEPVMAKLAAYTATAK
jgi:NADH-quinone oxidoreductase subunit M